MAKYPASIAEADEPEGHVKRCHEYVCEGQILDQHVTDWAEPLVCYEWRSSLRCFPQAGTGGHRIRLIKKQTLLPWKVCKVKRYPIGVGS